MTDLQKPAKGDWLVIGQTNDTYTENWNWAETKQDLKEEIEDRMGNEVEKLRGRVFILDIV